VDWLGIAVGILIVAAVVVWPLTARRRYIGGGSAQRARDVANQIYAGRPDDGFDAAPFDPVARGPLVPDPDDPGNDPERT
jgi:hypothetical protein